MAKQLVLRYPNWQALITYTGIARAGKNIPTVNWVASLFENKFELDFQEMLNIIEAAATNEFSKYSRYNQHTFAVGAFVNNEAVLALISNFQTLGIYGTVNERSLSKFQISQNKVKTRKVIPTGGGAAYWSKVNTRKLRHMLRGRDVSLRSVRQLISEVNISVAKLDHEKTISPSCSCYSITPNGGGGEHWGKVAGDYSPPVIMGGYNTGKMGIDLARRLAQSGEWPLGYETLKKNGSIQNVQSAW